MDAARACSRELSYVLCNIGSSLITTGMMLPATFTAGMTLPPITYLLLRQGVGERGIAIICSSNALGPIAGMLTANTRLALGRRRVRGEKGPSSRAVW